MEGKSEFHEYTVCTRWTDTTGNQHIWVQAILPLLARDDHGQAIWPFNVKFPVKGGDCYRPACLSGLWRTDWQDRLCLQTRKAQQSGSKENSVWPCSGCFNRPQVKRRGQGWTAHSCPSFQNDSAYRKATLSVLSDSANCPIICYKHRQTPQVRSSHLSRFEAIAPLRRSPQPSTVWDEGRLGDMPGCPLAALFACGWWFCKNATFHDL